MRFGIAALTVTVSLGFVGAACAEESGNWFTRLFTPTAEKIEPVKKLDVKTDPPKMPVSSLNNRATKAKAELERRQEVCLKLREIALGSGDDDLLRKADALFQRAWDQYVASTNLNRASERPAAESAAKKGERK
jgi:hypothetical protein